MKISFVIPAYNEEASISACVRSIQAELARTPLDAEIIVVDNASKDRTGEIARGIPGVRVVQEPRKGLPFARQAGFRASLGDLIANVDADTLLPPGWLSTALRCFSTENIVGLSGPYEYHDLPLRGRILTRVLEGIGFIFYLFNHYVRGKDGMVAGGNFLIRRDALEKIGGFDTSVEFWGEDVTTMRRLEKVGIVRWSWRFRILASGRRFMAEGILRRNLRDVTNYFAIMLKGKPKTFQYEDVRLPPRS